MVKYEPKAIEKKWQDIWAASKLFEPEINSALKKFFITVPIPYPDGFIHLGHLYTWTRADIYARFMRMNGYNVLFPQSFHVTGGPIIGMSNRINSGDEKTINVLKEQGVNDKELGLFGKNPKFLAEYFINTFKRDFADIGMSFDWRRTFVTTSLEPYFSRFIEWQFRRLRSLGLITQGSHPVVWCPHENTPLGDHDRLAGEGESPVMFTIIKFKCGEYVFPAATLRPETVFGVTNIWINPNVRYCAATMESGEKWIITENAQDKLKNQLKPVKTCEILDIKSFIDKKSVNPIDGKEVPILPADFVDADIGTGVAMSVPMHAPFDYNGLDVLKKKDSIKYGNIVPIKIIDVVDQKDLLKNAMNAFGTTKDGLEKATKFVYKKEFNQGVLNENAGTMNGIAAKLAKNNIIDLLKERKSYDYMFELEGEVVCRCGTRGEVKVLENQWFIRYSDKDWKAKARKEIEKMTVYPDEVKLQLLNTLDWLEDKAVARKGGLGTPLPWDREWLIEPLSDSTIYMAYYTIAHLIKNFDLNEVNDELFDYIFMNKRGKNIKNLSRLEKMRAEFEYWYPLDMRISAKELVQNHFLFFILNHVILFDEDKWPKAIGINGWLRIQGQKMSKSKGNSLTIHKALETYGADQLRLLATAGNGVDDEEWSTLNISGLNQRIEDIMQIIEIKDSFGEEEIELDRYLKSKLAKIINSATDNYKKLRYRSAVFSALFESVSELKFYISAGGRNKNLIMEYLETILKLNHPIFPHITDELFSYLGNTKMLEETTWPIYDENAIDNIMESEVEVVKATVEDIRNIISRIKKRPTKITIGIANSARFELYNKVFMETKHSRNVNEIRRTLRINDPIIDKLLKNPQKLPEKELKQDVEAKTFTELKQFIEGAFECQVQIIQKDKDEKAMPGKPSVEIE